MIQTELLPAYLIWLAHESPDIVCQNCAVQFATDNGLQWSGGHSSDSYTLDSEEKKMGVSCLSSMWDGESDYPYTCCDQYLQTNLTPDGIQHLKDKFPAWVQALYLVHENS